MKSRSLESGEDRAKAAGTWEEGESSGVAGKNAAAVFSRITSSISQFIRKKSKRHIS